MTKIETNEGRGGILMPKLQNRFRVMFHNFGDDVGNHKDIAIALTQQLTSCELPSISFEPVYDEETNSYSAGNATWEPTKFMFRNDLPSTALGKIVSHLQRQMDDPALEFSITIETLDGEIDQPTSTYRLEGCQILHFDNGSLTYSSSDACELSLVVKYRNATIS